MNDTGANEEGRNASNDPIVERLRQFTPECRGLDREALLFAAGRASVRPSRRWMVLAGALAACQLVSLGLLWPRTSGPASAPSGRSPTSVAGAPSVERPRDPDTASPNQLWVLRARMVSGGDDFRAPSIEGPLVPDEPPLRAFPLPSSKILN